ARMGISGEDTQVISKQAPSNVDYWQRFAQAYENYISARADLLTKAPSAVELIRAGMKSDRNIERAAALDMARLLTVEQLQELFGELLGFASYLNGFMHAARELI